MYQLIDTRTMTVIGEFYTMQTAEIRCNAMVFVFGPHYAIRPTFNSVAIYEEGETHNDLS